MDSNNRRVNTNTNNNNRRRSSRYNNQRNNKSSNYKSNYQNTNYKKRYDNNTKSRREDFSSDEMKFSDELDTSFVDGRRKRKEKIVDQLNQSYEKQKNEEKKPKKKKFKVFRFVFVFIVFAILFFGLGMGSAYLFLPREEKVVTEVKEKVVMDENVVFLGDSITEFYDLDTYYSDYSFVNSGVDGDETDDILEDMKGRVYQYNPSKVVILIGTNDIQHEKGASEVFSNIEKIVENIKQNRPHASIYLQSIYPVIEGKSKVGIRTNEVIKDVNSLMQSYCQKEDVTYIDVYPLLLDPEASSDALDENYTEDGLHLNDSGYEVVTNEIIKYIKE